MKSFDTYRYQVPAEHIIGESKDLTIDVTYCIIDGDIKPYEAVMTLATLKRIKDPFKLDKEMREAVIRGVTEELTKSAA